MRRAVKTPIWRTVLSPHEARDEYQKRSAKETGDEKCQPAVLRHDVELPEQRCRNRRADNAENDVDENAKARLHEFSGHPAGEAADDDCRNPADLNRRHCLAPKTVPCGNIGSARRFRQTKPVIIKRSARGHRRPARFPSSFRKASDAGKPNASVLPRSSRGSWR